MVVNAERETREGRLGAAPVPPVGAATAKVVRRRRIVGKSATAHRKSPEKRERERGGTEGGFGVTVG